MTEVAWKENEFEERSIDPRKFVSGGANTTIVEQDPLSYQVKPDLVYIAPSGRSILIECKFSSTTKDTGQSRYFRLLDQCAIHGGLIPAPFHRKPHFPQTPIVLSRLSIDEPSQTEANSAVSSWQDYEQENLAAINPVTKRVYEQLTSIPEYYQPTVQALLNEFASIVPQSEASKLPALRLTALEDSSYLMEWTFKDRRLGFSLEPDPKDSGWYYVFAREPSELYESGTMDQLETKRLILKALTA